MLTMSPSTRYCPYCHRATEHQDNVCSDCGQDVKLPEVVQQASRRSFEPVMLQVEPKGLLVDVFATALTTIGLLLIAVSAIRIATRPLVFLAPVQTVYNPDLDDVEALPVHTLLNNTGRQSPSVVLKQMPSGLDHTPWASSIVSEPDLQPNGLVFGFMPTTPQAPTPWPPLHKRYATMATPQESDSEPHLQQQK